LSNNNIDGGAQYSDGGVKQVVKQNNTLQYLNLQNNKLTHDCGQKLILWDNNQYLCFLLIDGNPKVSDQHRQRCEDFTERNRRRIYTSLHGGASSSASQPRVRKSWPFSPLGFCPDPRPINSMGKTDADPPSPHELPDKADNTTPEAATTSTSDSSSLPQQTASSATVSDKNTDNEAFTTPEKQRRTEMSDTNDRATPHTMRAPSEEKNQTRRTCVTLLLSAPLISKSLFGQQTIEHLEFSGERELLRRALRQSGQAIALRVRRATIDNFGEEVTRGCRVLHYSGHGRQDCLCFEDRYGGMEKMTAEKFKTLLTAGKQKQPQLQMVIISACYSQKTAQAFVDAGVPHVICVKIDTRLHDANAVIFTHHFYVALAQGLSVEKSFRIAKAQIKVQKGVGESDQFLLLPADADHSDKIFVDVPPACDKEHDALFRSDDCMMPPSFPNICEHFDGRNMDVYRVLNAVLKQKLVTLYGAKGSGKTSAAVAVCHYLWERRISIGDKRIPFWAHFVRLEGHRSIMDVLRKLLECVSKDADVLEDQGHEHSDMRESAPARGRSMSADADGHEPRSPRNSGVIELFTDRLVKRLQTESQRGGKHQILLILDHCDDVLRHDAIQFRTLLGTLLREGRDVKILAVSGTPIRGMQGAGTLEKTYLLEGLKPQDAMSLLLRCCPDAHAAIRLPATFPGFAPSSSDEDSDDDDDSRGHDPWLRLVERLLKIPVLQQLSPYYPDDIYKTANALNSLRGGLLGLLRDGRAEKKAVMKIVESKKDRNKKP